MQEIVGLLLIGYAGALSDRVGRRPLFALGFIVMAAGYALFPFATGTVELFVYRFIYAIGVAVSGVLFAVIAADYPAESSARQACRGIRGSQRARRCAGRGGLFPAARVLDRGRVLEHRGSAPAAAWRRRPVALHRHLHAPWPQGRHPGPPSRQGNPANHHARGHTRGPAKPAAAAVLRGRLHFKGGPYPGGEHLFRSGCSSPAATRASTPRKQLPRRACCSG